MSLKDKSKRNDTGQSKHQWRLKDLKKDFAIRLKILAKAKSYNNKKKDATYAIPKNSTFYINRTWQHLTNENELVSNC